jgi:hypothetical protein
MNRPWAQPARPPVRSAALGLPLLLALSVAVGCLGKAPPKRDGSAGGTASGGSESEPDPDVVEGSCDAWKVAYCKAIAACSAFESEKDCQIRVGYIACLGDAPLGSCEKKIKTALSDKKCDDLPSGCDPPDVADRSVPTRACKDLYQAICERSFFCGFETSIETCEESLELSQPCSSFTALLPTFDDCLARVQEQSCQDVSPDSCQGVLQR